MCLIIESVESETYVFHQGSNRVEALKRRHFQGKKWGLFFRGKLERFAEAMLVSSVGWS